MAREWLGNVPWDGGSCRETPVGDAGMVMGKTGKKLAGSERSLRAGMGTRKGWKRLGKTGKGWKRLGKAGKDWERLGRAGKFWERLAGLRVVPARMWRVKERNGKTGKNWERLAGSERSLRAGMGMGKVGKD